MEVSTLTQMHIGCFRTRVLKKTEEVLFVNFVGVEVRSRLTLFVTDKDVVSFANRTCSYSAVIKKKRTKDNNKYYIEEGGRNLEHSEDCVRNSANCPGNTTILEAADKLRGKSLTP